MKKIILIFISIVLSVGVKAQYVQLADLNGSNGRQPYGSLISDGTFLYGMTGSGGTYSQGNIFKMMPDGTNFSNLHQFYSAVNSDGYGPCGSLFYDGTFLYGTTIYGGTAGIGTIFKVKTDGTNYSKMHDFLGVNSSDGSTPKGSLISDGTFLYGMTYDGGTSRGTIFKIKPDGTYYSTIYNFPGGSGGAYPYGSLIYDGTYLYGMGYGGGSIGWGIIFKIKTNGTGFIKLLDFTGSNGETPSGSLVSDGTFLYGMTGGGGTANNGTIFKIKPDGTGYVKLSDFSNPSNGGGPGGSLCFAGTYLYGMAGGGLNGMGVVFKIKPDGSGYSDLFDFSGTTTGSNPQGDLFFDGTTVYGMTNAGGINNFGTIFKFNEIGMGVIENNTKIDFNIYPNPSNGNIFVEVGLVKDEYTHLNVMNSLGQIIISQEHDLVNGKNKFNLDLSNLSKGIYFIQIQTLTDMVTRKITLN